MEGSYQKPELHRGTLSQISTAPPHGGGRSQGASSRHYREGEPFSGLFYLWGPRTHLGILGLLGSSSPTACPGVSSAKSGLPLISTHDRETLGFSLKKMQCHVQAYVRIRVRRSDSQRSLNLIWNRGRSLRGTGRQRGWPRSSGPRGFGTESQSGQGKEVHYMWGKGQWNSRKKCQPWKVTRLVMLESSKGP